MCDGLDADRGSRWRQDDGRILVPRLRHRVHDAPPEPDQEDVVRPDDAGARHPQEDGGDHHARGVDQRRQGVRQQTVSERFFFLLFLRTRRCQKSSDQWFRSANARRQCKNGLVYAYLCIVLSMNSFLFTRTQNLVSINSFMLTLHSAKYGFFSFFQVSI